MNSGQQGGTGSCTDDLVRWWAGVPIATKSIFVVASCLTLLDLFSIGIGGYLVDSPALIMKFQIWRLFFAQYANDIMSLIFGLLSISQAALVLERQLGSILFFLDFLLKNFLIQLIFVVIIFTCDLLFSIGLKYQSFGLFNTVILFISLRSFSDPESSSNFLCFPITLKNKYQPFAIVLFFTLISGAIRFDFLAAIFLGFIEVKYFGGMVLRISPAKLGQLKNSFLFRSFTGRSDFIDSDGSFTQLPQAGQSGQQSSTTSAFQGRSVTIGGSPNTGASSGQSRPNQQTIVINPSQNEPSDQKVFVGKAVSIGGAPILTPEQQRELQLKRFQQQEQQEQDQKTDIETQGQNSSNDSANDQNILIGQKQPPKKDGYSALSEDLL